MDLFPTATLSAFSIFGAVATALAGVITASSVQLFHLLVFVSTYLLAALSAVANLIGSVVVWPFSIASAVAFLILSPVIYTVAYAVAPFWYLANVVPRLEPLYIFFGSAAFVGVVAGIFVKLSSDAFVSALRLDKKDDEQAGRDLVRRPSSTASTAGSSLPSSAAAAVKREEDYFLTGGTGSDIDWQVIDRIERFPISEHSRRMPLLQSIILEEEDDDEGSVAGGY